MISVLGAGGGRFFGIQIYRAALLGWAIIFLGVANTRAEVAFPAEQTWIFLTGLLEWEDAETFDSFPQGNRQDEQMLAFFRKLGVPASQIRSYRDREATLAKVSRGWKEFVADIPEDGVLLFYYCGHGYDDDGRSAFAAWDSAQAGGWGMADVVKVVASEFRGRRALLLADCCQSGALVKAVRAVGSRAKSGAPLAAVSSSSARESSTGDWTFTESFLDALNGRVWADRDGNGKVTLEEFAVLARDEMAIFQSQRASADVPEPWTPEAVLASTSGARGGRMGERVLAKAEGEWWKGRIVDARDGEERVRFVGYFEEDDLWLGPKNIKPLAAPKRYAVGTEVDVKWQGEWWPARVLEEKDGTHLIRYDGYGSEWDEWAPPARLRLRK